ncbi:MAG: YjjW family glycine radical enzyme activase [Alphaproteobacteria bacterium]|jgi:pyruvate formate lyase activating enzyme|nr:YjjW family glycine radical enzyme activase [Alphaproteobacteria bacterium]MBT4084161.1 YjjW family glycine radical enzyme activase [Alphaproteobacteria bacterium]MBT4545802.1 YjjW family glycine radical enzyme activase [Alphaproteobacteria bacterium]MBT7747728.1 YjjW family glycine radical enzyme activase [Alphaproteobacteria bacterium]
MNSPLATLNKILTCSFVDGPGNRLVLFFQGCNLACSACHNPYTIGICDHCGDCVPACDPGALTLQSNKVIFNPALCDQCDACLTICPISASPMTTQFSVDDILALIRIHKPFLGGITVSGGEATMQADFVKDLFTAIKSAPDLSDLTCFIDSNGMLDIAGWQNLLPVTDGVMLDIKAFAMDLQKELTGHDTSAAQNIARVLLKAGKLYEIRYLLIPGKTDNTAELDQLVAFIQSLGLDTKVRLNAFQHHGVRGLALDQDIMPKEGVDAVVELLADAGIHNVTTPAIYQ